MRVRTPLPGRVAGRPSALPSRRMTLRGALASLALPFLPSALPRGARADASAPKRMIFWYVPNGIQYENDAWTPSTVGPDWELKLQTEPLGALRSKVNLISGLWNDPEESPIIDADHARGTGCYLTCVPIKYTAGDDIENGVSIDQYAAAAAATPFSSVQLGMEPGGSTGDCNGGYSCAYLRNLAWAAPATPLPNIVDPALAFQLLFPSVGSQLSASELALRSVVQGSALDYVNGEANLLAKRINAEDRLKLDEYLTAVRDLELRIRTLGSGCATPATPGSGLDVPAGIQAMCDLQALALQCDLTRVVTFMMANSASNRSFPWLGITDAHHELSHHDGSDDKIALLQTIGRWEVEQYAYLLGKLDAVTEANGQTILDNSAVFFSSEIQDGNAHTHMDLPILVAGSLGGALNTGNHLVYEDEPLANLFLALMEGFDAPMDAFGNSTRVLPDLLA